jgi:hypothetical protein
MGRWGTALGPAVIRQIHDGIVQIAQAKGVVQGPRVRVDTTVVESNIHDLTDSSLLGDGVRVLTRSMRKITQLTGATVPSCATAAAVWGNGCWRLPAPLAAKRRRAATG